MNSETIVRNEERRQDRDSAPPPDDSRVVEALEEYVQAMETGARPNRAAFLARHAEIAVPLAACLDGLDFVHVTGHELTPPSSGTTVSSHNTGGGSPLGDFRILRELGRGGMGVVYEAEQISLGRRVALKVLPFASTLDAKQLQRFKNEAQAAAHLHHQNIVPVHATGCERGVHYYAMQLIDGHTLAEVITDLRKPDASSPSPPGTPGGEGRGEGGQNPTENRGAPARVSPLTPNPSPPECRGRGETETPPNARLSTLPTTRGRAYFHAIAQLGAQAAEALDYSHEFGVVHRDVKPANMLIDGRGKLWITDFGLAHCQSQAGLTMSGDLVGTLRYMSPEQALAKRVIVDHRTDIYSLGATLYELLTLEPVFTGDDRQELLRQIAFEEPAPPRRHNNAIPVELETIILKALEKNPADRYATAKELAEDLERFVKDEPIKARRPSLARRAKGWCRTHKPLVAVLVTLLVLAGASLLWQAHQRAATAQSVENDLTEAESFWKQKQWAKALPALERASGRLAGSGLTSLQATVDARRKDVAMIERLDDALLQVTTDVLDSNIEDWASVLKAYQSAFVEYGLDVKALGKEESARRIRASEIRSQLIRGLDDWAYFTDRIPGANGQPLRDIAQLADDDAWRIRLRELRLTKDRRELERLAEEKEAIAQPQHSVARLVDILYELNAGDAAIHLGRKAQQLNPGDFWLNLDLAHYLLKDHLMTPTTAADAVGFIRAALAVKADSPGVHLYLARALDRRGKRSEAEAARRKALELNPNRSATHVAIGHGLIDQKKWPEAEAAFRRAITLRPDNASAHNGLGLALSVRGNADAEAAFRMAISINPELVDPHANLGRHFLKHGKFTQADAQFRKALQIQIAHASNLYGQAVVHSLLKRHRELLDIFWHLSRFFPFHMRHASVAALCAEIDDAGIIAPKELARVRGKALHYLQSELAVKKESLEKMSGESRRELEKDMRSLLTHADFRFVRGAEALAKLPESERREWRKLWEDIEELRKQAAPRGGFIQDWLILSELIPYEGDDAVKALDGQQIPAEALLRPRAGDRVDVNGKSLVWKQQQTAEAHIDFAAVYETPTEYRVAYCVCYVHADADRADLTLCVGSDDQAMVYLNGQAIHRQPDSRLLELDEDKIRPVALRKGSNVLVFKVVNQVGGHFGSLRFLSKDGSVPEGIEFRLTP
jgi:serine/threonine protein kinase/Tfp pilus assembly protein PilF